tara:strand:+ start:9454 stop:10923 length:1470 start_codon:yes stop_codon:yes gene_type:complete
MRLQRYLAGLGLGVAFTVSVAAAAPFAEVGDQQLRNDVELLARYGLISGPVGTWPLSWKHITRDFHKADGQDLPPHVIMALRRVERKVPGEWRVGLKVMATTEPEIVRGFDETARNDLDTSATLQYNGTSTTAKLNVGYRNGNGTDDYNFDGSYLAQELGNWQVYAGAIDRWWGPGREGTLLLSNNARPMPSVGIMRMEPEAFESKWLSWMGPWQLRAFVAQMEEDRHVPDALIAGLRLTFEPVKNFEVGLARTIQLCGEGRPCDLETWARALIAGGDLDNTGTAREPGNQLASVDMAYSFGIGKETTLKIYGEATAEDEAGQLFLPKRFARLLGASAYGPWGDGGAQWRLTAEYADTTSTEYWLFGDRRNNLIYEHHIYRSGYRFKGRSLGHSIDGDGRLISIIANFLATKNWGVTIKYHNVLVNRDGARKFFGAVSREKINIIESLLQGENPFGTWEVWINYQDDSLNSPEMKDSELLVGGRVSKYF